MAEPRFFLEVIRTGLMLLSIAYAVKIWRKMRYIGLLFIVMESMLSLMVMLSVYLNFIEAREILWSLGVLVCSAMHLLSVYYIWVALKRFG